MEYLSTYIEITNSRSDDVQGGKRILVKCTMPVMKVLAEHLKIKLLDLALKKKKFGRMYYYAKARYSVFPGSFINDVFEKWNVYITTIMYILRL